MAETVQQTQLLDKLNPQAHWLLRFALAGIFLYHGLNKVSGGTPPAGMLDMMFLGSAPLFWLTALLEVLAGIAIVAGGSKTTWAPMATRVAGGIIAAVMIGAIAIVHAANGWNFMTMGAEFQTLTAAVGIYLLIKGA